MSLIDPATPDEAAQPSFPIPPFPVVAPSDPARDTPGAAHAGIPEVPVPVNVLGNLVNAVDTARRGGAFNQLPPIQAYLVHQALLRGLELLAPHEVRTPPAA